MQYLSLLILVACTACRSTPLESPGLRKLTPILVVERVENSVEFWVDRLEFSVTAEVSGEDGKLAFVSLERDGI